MAENIEIKARVDDMSALRDRVRESVTSGPVFLIQRDTFISFQRAVETPSNHWTGSWSSLMDVLAIAKRNLIGKAYVDLMVQFSSS